MSRSRKSSKRSQKRAATKSQNPASRTPAKMPESKRSVAKDLLFGVIVCIVFFAAVEAGLRLAGIPASDPGEDPFVGFSALKPLFTVEDGVVRTAGSRLKYFNKESFKVEKPPGSTRIFCFGGSTTYGRPFDGRTAFPRWLKELLIASCPERGFEVINAGGISYASYRIVPLIREVMAFQPDLVVLYTGHNEFLERRTYRGLFEQGKALITAEALLDRVNLYRLLKRILVPLVGRKDSNTDRHNTTAVVPADREGSAESAGDNRPRKSILGDEVTAILDRSAGLDIYHRDEEFAKGVIRHFAHNLRRMIAICRENGVPVLVIQPASNLKDFSPFKSEHDPAVDKQAQEEVRRAIAESQRLIEQGEFERALTSLERAAHVDPLYAMTHYWMGRALSGLGRTAEAEKSFIRAKDLDVCPLRCISPLIEDIRKIAEEEQTLLINFPAILKQQLAESGDSTGVPGNESFMDHVHPTIERHQLLAEHILAKMSEHGLVRPSKKLTKDERADLYARAVNSFDAKFFATKDLNLAKVLRWAGKNEEARVALLRAANVLDEHPEVHKIMGSLLMDKGDYGRAIAEYQKAVRLSGNDPQMIYCLAVAYYKSGARDDATKTYDELVRHGAEVPDAYSNLAMIHLEEGRVDQGLKVGKAALDRGLETGAVAAAYGLALAVSGDAAAGIPWMRRALELEPNDADHLYNLAGMYALAGKPNEALNSLESAVRRGYGNLNKIAGDPVFATLRTDPRFRELLSGNHQGAVPE